MLAVCTMILKKFAIKNPSSTLWVVGDFNLPDIDWDTVSIISYQYRKVINEGCLETINSIGLEQLVDEPTRNDKIFDLFLTNRPTFVNKCKVIPGVNDHEAVIIDSDTKARRQRPAKRKICLWKRADPDKIKEVVQAFSNEFIANHDTSTPVEDLWNCINKKLCQVMEDHIPSKFTSERFNQPWINSSVKKLSRRKKKAYKTAKKTNSASDWQYYKELKKLDQFECRKRYHSFLNNMVCEDSSLNPKKFWNFIKGKKSDNTGVAPLKRNGIAYSNSKTKAQILNQQFTSVFTSEDTDHLPNLGPSPYPDLSNIKVHVQGVVKLLKNLNPHKATGPDNLPSRLLKEVADEIAPSLTLLFQATLTQGCIPAVWKEGLITPVFKKGDRSIASNYRPISLTSICCKLQEHIIHGNIMAHLDKHKILSDDQHGFRKRRSCETQLIITLNDLAKGLNSKQQIDAVLLDFSKAFDRVPHKRLLLKLQFYGIRGEVLQWISAFLTGRTQRVLIEGQSSSTSLVTSGVPQGTVLGPLLFLVFINDLPAMASSTTRLFADDCLMYRTIQDTSDAEALQADLDKLQQWEQDWLMDFNPSKCEVITITNKRSCIPFTYTIHNEILNKTSCAKYLGINITNNLSWRTHVDKVCKKANSTQHFYSETSEAALGRSKRSALQHLSDLY